MCVCFRLLVGAPRAKALKGQKSKVTGGLYSCDMSSTSAGCDRVNFDNDGEISANPCAFVWHGLAILDTIFSRFDKQCPPGVNCCLFAEDLRKESKENQWMGVTVQSQGPGGKIVVRLFVFNCEHELDQLMIVNKIVMQKIECFYISDMEADTEYWSFYCLLVSQYSFTIKFLKICIKISQSLRNP